MDAGGHDVKAVHCTSCYARALCFPGHWLCSGVMDVAEEGSVCVLSDCIPKVRT